MNDEERIKALVGDNENIINSLKAFIMKTYDNMESGLKDLEVLAQDTEKFHEFLQVCQNNYDLKSTALGVADMLNYKEHSKILSIPVLNNAEIKESDNPRIILTAKGDGFSEELSTDGPLNDETFDERVQEIIGKEKLFMEMAQCEDVDNSFIYFKDYTNDIFNFKIYVCDIFISSENEKKVIREIKAFFLEPRMNDVYELKLSAGPFGLPTQLLKIKTIDLANDQLTMALDKIMQSLLDNLKYKDTQK